MKHNFRLGLGPMSLDVVNAITTYASANQQPLMIIASRNQVDTNSGYVMNTAALRTAIDSNPSDYVLLCRDHCGPYFLDSEKSLSQADAVEATKRTIAGDIEQGFDLIHIDTSRCDDVYAVAEDLINFSLNLNPNIKFEFGTEENVGVAASIVQYHKDVDFAKQFPNMEFVVAQTGSLVYKYNQVGSFDLDIVRDLAAYAESAGVKLKEHNADYLTVHQLGFRKYANVHAMNVAPQLGTMQTSVIKLLAEQNNLGEEWSNWVSAVIASGRWSKWTESPDQEVQLLVGGHYLFSDPTFAVLDDKLSSIVDWRAVLNRDINDFIKLYTENI